MNCSSFERWLDAGMPESEARRALAHAGSCRVCAPTLAEARAVEAALRAEAPGAAESPVASADLAGAASSAAFVDAVMARVQVEAEAAAVRGADDPARTGEATPAPWLLRLFVDPVSVVSVTLAVVVGAVTSLEPEWVTAGASAISAYGRRAVEGLAAWPVLSRPTPAALALAAAIAPLAAFAAVAVYRSFERAIVLMAAGRRR